ncbi:MAG: hypothetical protein MJ233_03550 [Mycoplasmoidaceae bacterium]|nr:hypothetical protein [Mycoplasmoidaceae bacterium]
MVVLDAMCYTIKQYGFTLDTATIDMSIDVTKDDNHGYLISLSNELHVKISYDGMLIYSFDGKEVIKNIQYMFKYKEEDGGTVLPLVKE